MTGKAGCVWLQVRVIDKHVSGGRLYLKKGTVVDVHPGGLCDVKMDEGREMAEVRGHGCAQSQSPVLSLWQKQARPAAQAAPVHALP